MLAKHQQHRVFNWAIHSVPWARQVKPCDFNSPVLMVCLCSSKIGARSQEIATPSGSWEQTEGLFIITTPCWSRAYLTFQFCYSSTQKAMILNPNKAINKRVPAGRSQVLCNLPVPAAGRSCVSAVLVPRVEELCLPPFQLLQVNHCSEYSSRVSKPFLQQKKGSSETA